MLKSVYILGEIDTFWYDMIMCKLSIPSSMLTFSSFHLIAVKVRYALFNHKSSTIGLKHRHIWILAFLRHIQVHHF